MKWDRSVFNHTFEKYFKMDCKEWYRVILSLEAPNYCLPASIQRVCQSINVWWTNCRVLPTRRCNMSHFKCQHARNWKFFFKDRIMSKNFWPPRFPDLTPAYFFIWGPTEGQSVHEYTPHNRTTQRRYTPRDCSRQHQHFGNSIPEFGETHSSVLGCERRPFSASIMSRSCFASFPVCVYKFSSHYRNNIIFYRQ